MPPAEEPSAQRPENHLANAASPYLRAHARDPVAWVPWGERALKFARRTDRPLLISVGYQSCHWCHVMQRESFADPDLAGFINRHFVPVKVDREIRPDVDAFYMAFVNVTTGSGGWPMTVFATPDGLPFYGGTYFSNRSLPGSSSFREVLDAILKSWTLSRDTTLDSANEALGVLRETERGSVGEIDRATLDSAAESLRDSEDVHNGGFAGAPKFPQAPAVSFLLAYSDLTGHVWPVDLARRQVLAMLRGGIYDQVGGGLFRYSTDARWHVPHFEKMLYDQALLLSTLAALGRRQASPELAHYARATHAFLMRDLARDGGGFSSALDAETGGIEGASYMWTYSELEQVLTPEELTLAQRHLGVTDSGDSSAETLVLTRRTGREIEADSVDALLSRLAELRAGRSKPALIDNAITSWNALAARGLVEAGAAFEDDAMIASGTACLTWLLETAVRRTSVVRAVGDESIANVHFLEDYAALAAAALSVAGVTGDEAFLRQAEKLQSWALRAFGRDDGSFALCAGKTALPFDPIEQSDSPIPSGAALFAENAVRLSAAGLGDREIARKPLSQFARTARLAPYLAGHALAVSCLLETWEDESA